MSGHKRLMPQFDLHNDHQTLRPSTGTMTGLVHPIAMQDRLCFRTSVINLLHFVLFCGAVVCGGVVAASVALVWRCGSSPLWFHNRRSLVWDQINKGRSIVHNQTVTCMTPNQQGEGQLYKNKVTCTKPNPHKVNRTIPVTCMKPNQQGKVNCTKPNESLYYNLLIDLPNNRDTDFVVVTVPIV